MKIVNLEPERIGEYVRTQISNFFPNGTDPNIKMIDKHLARALSRTDHCISQVKVWEQGCFDVLHSSQYCIFLYYLANTVWRAEGSNSICIKLFLLNKALNAIDCFYEIDLPEVFYIGHSVGIVLSKAIYGNHLVLYQNSTVGKNHGVSPIIEECVVLYPNTAVIGDCVVKCGTIVAQGVSIINISTESKKIAFQDVGGGLVFKDYKRNIFGDFFRDV